MYVDDIVITRNNHECVLINLNNISLVISRLNANKNLKYFLGIEVAQFNNIERERSKITSMAVAICRLIWLNKLLQKQKCEIMS